MINNFFWDFDGVLLDSNKCRENGFRIILKEFKKKDVDKLILFHKKNGGLSRYVKLNFFFNEVLQIEIKKEKLNEYFLSFSKIMKRELVNKNLLISKTLNFIKKNNGKRMFIVSGSDDRELNFLCKKLKIDNFFEEIKGSPTPKNILVREIIKKYNLNKKECLLIGDSINDYEAAEHNDIYFKSYNNHDLLKYDTLKIKL